MSEGFRSYTIARLVEQYVGRAYWQWQAPIYDSHPASVINKIMEETDEKSYSYPKDVDKDQYFKEMEAFKKERAPALAENLAKLNDRELWITVANAMCERYR